MLRQLDTISNNRYFTIWQEMFVFVLLEFMVEHLVIFYEVILKKSLFNISYTTSSLSVFGSCSVCQRLLLRHNTASPFSFPTQYICTYFHIQTEHMQYLIYVCVQSSCHDSNISNYLGNFLFKTCTIGIYQLPEIFLKHNLGQYISWLIGGWTSVLGLLHVSYVRQMMKVWYRNQFPLLDSASSLPMEFPRFSSSRGYISSACLPGCDWMAVHWPCLWIFVSIPDEQIVNCMVEGCSLHFPVKPECLQQAAQIIYGFNSITSCHARD